MRPSVGPRTASIGPGTAALAARTGSPLFTWPAVVLYALLVAAWAAVACRSLGHVAAHAGRPKSRA
ncbi:hypothetical protein GCM10017744_006130 [Streptomyces antimycoticus]|uniref:Uncharacterized protein n=1 Tax=Streptomyces antimycoticus TaxID=68175 RepID=A0A4D4KPS7_9ACTN|nr:hypothetical protein [Streptomyces antimycoticus]GDY48488.1 hypothetical protein SANT12839_093700 [Streptomyces antimycoticus]